nr:hypothetical protein [Saprospiraceae bacterium]
AIFFMQIFGGFIGGAIAASVTWIGVIVFGMEFRYIIFSILFLFYLLTLLIMKNKKNTDEQNFIWSYFNKYIFAVISFVVIFCLANYFYTTYLIS